MLVILTPSYAQDLKGGFSDERRKTSIRDCLNSDKDVAKFSQPISAVVYGHVSSLRSDSRTCIF